MDYLLLLPMRWTCETWLWIHLTCSGNKIESQDEVTKLSKNKNLKIVIWGASTHSITLLSLIQPEGIEFIVDSSEYKQNRFTPISNIPVYSPSKIVNSNIDLIIIMAPRYTKEIIEQLKTELKFEGKIIALENCDLVDY